MRSGPCRHPRPGRLRQARAGSTGARRGVAADAALAVACRARCSRQWPAAALVPRHDGATLRAGECRRGLAAQGPEARLGRRPCQPGAGNGAAGVADAWPLAAARPSRRRKTGANARRCRARLYGHPPAHAHPPDLPPASLCGAGAVDRGGAAAPRAGRGRPLRRPPPHLHALLIPAFAPPRGAEHQNVRFSLDNGPHWAG